MTFCGMPEKQCEFGGVTEQQGAEVELGNSDFSFWEQVHFTTGFVLYNRHTVGNREFVIQNYNTHILHNTVCYI